MNCPHCNVPLMMAERKGVEIDFCGQCRGVWLDKGELDKIIELTVNERTGGEIPSRNQYAQQPQSQPHYQNTRQQHSGYQDTRHYQNNHHNGYHRSHYKHKKKKSVFGEIFDIFD